MNRKWLAIVNIVIMLIITSFVVVYTNTQREKTYSQQVDNFVNTTMTMEHVTENYLQGEQGICDIWTQYINSHNMTIEDATEFVRSSHVIKNTSAHLIYTDTLTGLSTRENIVKPGDYAVSYAGIDIFGDMQWIKDLGVGINVSRAFTNPMNGEQSLAFVNRISLYDPASASMRDALVLRIVPISDMEQKWVFPQEEFENTEMSLIDESGNYIIRGPSFKNSNFYEFYRSYNDTDPAMISALQDDIALSTGSFTMTDSRGRRCVIAYTPITVSEGWSLLGYIPEEILSAKQEDWMLIIAVAAGLLVLFIVNLMYLRGVNRQLQFMAAEAESANRAKTDFLSTMSHDIRTPMNAIVGLTALAEHSIDDTETVRDDLRKISLASNHLLTLINDILDISKVESGSLSLSPVTFSIVETVENLVNISQPMIKEKNIEFSFHTDRMEKEYLHADQLRLNQIYINILSNAIKYTQPGGSVTVGLSESTSEKEGCVKLTYTVADTGMGMSPEFMEVMYQPFSRQTDSRVNSIQGTGLGLAITKQMVDLMGGTIDCQSEVGSGTTFTIVLDLPVAERQREDMELGPIEVLVVDDDEILLETAVYTLSSLGARVDMARSGQQALEMIDRRIAEGKNYDVIILDWKMKGMDGLETIQRIRSEEDSEVPILLVSAYDWTDIEKTAREQGANGFVSKPLFRSVLYDKINEVRGVEAKSTEPEEDYSDIAGMNILVAEDNDINWEIIHAMLGMFGITSVRAPNGRICVDMMKEAGEGQYALIFMDVQMPEMNGLDATRNIRALDDPAAAGIPIIAMTADAFSENIAECLAAGMNGHIAKPVDMKLVIKEIRRIKEEAVR